MSGGPSISDLMAMIYVADVWECKVCHVETNWDGEEAPCLGGVCSGCGAPMERLTWRSHGEALERAIDAHADRAMEAGKALGLCRNEIKRLRYELTPEKKAARPDASLEKPLFVPLKKEYYEAFESGEKKIEYRRYGARWNEATCRVGRRVILSCGYGKRRRMLGVIAGFSKSREPLKTAPWRKCYGPATGDCACIEIEVIRAIESPVNLEVIL